MSQTIVTEITTPNTPSSNKVTYYAKSGGELHKMDDTGTEFQLVPVRRTTGALPTAPSHVAMWVVDGGTGVGDILYISLKRSSDDVFKWTPIVEMP